MKRITFSRGYMGALLFGISVDNRDDSQGELIRVSLVNGLSFRREVDER